jgi:hypothetical protein
MIVASVSFGFFVKASWTTELATNVLGLAPPALAGDFEPFEADWNFNNDCFDGGILMKSQQE